MKTAVVSECSLFAVHSLMRVNRFTNKLIRHFSFILFRKILGFYNFASKMLNERQILTKSEQSDIT